MVDIAAKTEECGFGVVFGQIVEHPFGDARCRTIIERQIQRFGCAFDLPLEFREETPHKLWRVINYSNHCFKISPAKISIKTDNGGTMNKKGEPKSAFNINI